MINNFSVEDTNTCLDNVNTKVSIDLIPDNELNTEERNITVAALSNTTPDSPRSRILQEMCSKAVAEGYYLDASATEETTAKEMTAPNLEPGVAADNNKEATEIATDNFILISEEALLKL